ncbi:MAG: excinuclease ABC subunit UvrC [Lentimicrobiaceae bacterium]|jgi:excinuclease ABC subunit C|nr:excinuclease ABC subunit UvrC [Lentimicrobiaceae bacterium]MBT3454016.1 excinuclease ABC subunit UvrC [Lentimicrobiaceae bacterium]MBT3819134.1 excinuclease ABC subunit UvrC [Lentimicrobiaceae bacterium]MBT4060562.1 excinuclease ABC subunit UvrC [Lentimicrobiaceae bacterium]MBT4189654.1 excinuclease ABC subunit UvrC [Lentimicrobiaceae bacterium]
MAEHINLAQIIKTLPERPGVYQYFNGDGIIIYVGKAKNIKKRVSSYFTRSHQSGKVKVLVKMVADIKCIVTDTELDALLLENNLIKKYQPKYNIQLKDDKSFPWLCIKKEPFPRIISTRHVIKDGSEYFGPYASVRMMKTLMEIVKQLYQIRTCSLNLSQVNIKKDKYKVCLEFHLGNCLGPCVDKQSEEDYNNTISQVKRIIKGNISSVIEELAGLMTTLAANMEFEKAHLIKEKIEILEKYKSKSTIVNPRIHNVDVVSMVKSKNHSYINYLKVINGSIIQAHTVEVKTKLEETDQEILSYTLMDFRNRFDSQSKEIIAPFDPGITIPDVIITVPKRGDKKHLLELSERNAKHTMIEKQKQKDLINPNRHKNRILAQMQKDLRMNVIPSHIECFDNSNFQGDYPVAAMVQFIDTLPNKKGYRHYNIKTVEGPNDFASMEEVVKRRYSRLLNENKSLPQLIIVDGGKGQLSSAVKALKSIGLYGKIAIVGIAKRLEELYFPDDSVPLYINKTSETLKVIQRMRDEAHRFGITHHRKKFEKGTIKSELTSIEGIGFSTAQKLLWKFKSVKKIRAASLNDLSDVIGKSKAKIVFSYFNNQGV